MKELAFVLFLILAGLGAVMAFYIQAGFQSVPEFTDYLNAHTETIITSFGFMVAAGLLILFAYKLFTGRW